MRELGERFEEWCRGTTPFATATVVGVRGSAPRPPGATMAVSAEGEVLGSVSGGCVEGALYELASSLLPDRPAQVATYGISDDDAFSVGLTCGGILDVLVAPVTGDDAGLLADVVRSEKAGEPVALAVVTNGAGRGARLAVWPDRQRGSLGNERLDSAVANDVRGMLAQGQDGTRHYGPEGQRRADDVEVFVQSFAPPPRMIVFGAIDFASAVARLGVFLGYRVTVCDARAVFATRERFPEAHEVVCDWPHRYLAATEVDERTVICVLTHDPKFDVPVLELALRRPAAYIGAMGSRRTHEDRLARLREAGLTDEELARLASPIGLDIGARTPEETAVSIAADIIRHRWGGTGLPLTERAGAIHASLERAGA
ncbi:MAG TPA: XdhC/CoxI family protein [Acidimicrobiales bacterium]|nr:XdhC/CoxI family protein [Acidimicrobiales bacterium]